MPLTLSCVRCARNVDTDWRYCPFCGASQATRRELLELLRQAGTPPKAKELSRLLSNRVGGQVQKSEVNRILYRLLNTGIVQRDSYFRWSLIATDQRPIARHDKLPRAWTQPLAELTQVDRKDPLERPSDIQSSPEVSTEIGHWIFSLGGGKSERVLWKFRCSLCEWRIHRPVRGEFVLWLWDRLRSRRLRHDREAHPHTLVAQATAERARLVESHRKDHSATKMPAHPRRRPVDPSRLSVDDAMKASVGRRLMRGFSLLKGNELRRLP